ncbi:MAG: terminase small subunit [Tannerella sp.]|nr:terminase small subunit [Tannerella sp.]
MSECNNIRDKELTAKEEKFCYEYTLYLNATKAAINAGYSEKTAYAAGSRLLKNVKVQEHIKHLRENLAETAEISALRVLKEHEKIAFSNAGQLRDGWITLKDFESLTEDQKACIQEVSSRRAKKVGDGGETIIEEWVKIKIYDKQKSLDSIRAMLGFDAPEKKDITTNGNDINGVQLVFSPTPLSPRDIEDIKNLQHGGKEDRADAGIPET